MRTALLFCLAASCAYVPRCGAAEGRSPGCVLDSSDSWGPDGTIPLRVETVAGGLVVPWSFAFLSGGDTLISERPGRVRLLHEGTLVREEVLSVQIAEVSEGGLLGIAIHPRDPSLLYLYATVPGPQNQVQRWKLAPDHRSAKFDKVILAGIGASPYHDGGRIRFGPDGMLYVATGDARQPDRAQLPASLNGKLLRLTPEGEVPKDNPRPGNPLWLLGIRNLQAFDWLDDATLAIADHGPSGELLRRANDEVSLAHKGDNLGWPTIYGCQERAGMVSPILAWERQAAPPGGLVVYRGSAIPELQGSILVATLGSRHLHRLALEGGKLKRHEVYFRKDLGRLREIATTPSGELWMTTSNCDGRGTCGPDKDLVLRVLKR
jgi:glucose/arabinose dehydrogenase